MDGGFRGRIRLVPELPVGQHLRHLRWILEASRDFELFFAPEQLGASPSADDPLAQRPSIFTAVNEQLGLKLLPEVLSKGTIYIEHIERPTPN